MYILIIHTYVFCQVFPFWIKVIYGLMDICKAIFETHPH